MNSYTNSIDTDRAIGSILSNFDSAWVMHTIDDSLQYKFRPFSDPMPNFVDILNRQFDAVLAAGLDYKDKIEETRTETFIEIIEKICNFYNLEFAQSFDNISNIELYGIAHNLYDIFIARFTEYMIEFYTKYIVYNMEPIYNYLANDPNVRKYKEKDIPQNMYIDPKFILIHANLNKVIINMTSYDISLQTLLNYFVEPSVANRLNELLSDKGDIYKNFYASYLLDDIYMSQLLTCIKLKLQSRTQEIMKINTTINNIEEVIR